MVAGESPFRDMLGQPGQTRRYKRPKDTWERSTEEYCGDNAHRFLRVIAAVPDAVRGGTRHPLAEAPYPDKATAR